MSGGVARATALAFVERIKCGHADIVDADVSPGLRPWPSLSVLGIVWRAAILGLCRQGYGPGLR